MLPRAVTNLPQRCALRFRGLSAAACAPSGGNGIALQVRGRGVSQTAFLFSPLSQDAISSFRWPQRRCKVDLQQIKKVRFVHTSSTAVASADASKATTSVQQSKETTAQDATAEASTDPVLKAAAHNKPSETLKQSEAAAQKEKPEADSTARSQATAQAKVAGEDLADAKKEGERSEENSKGEQQESSSERKEESWWRRKWHAFKSEGKDFSLFYLPFYPATFVLLYAAFATNALHKESILDYVLSFMGNYVDRKKMYERIEAWNTWANLGFAFVINELLEVVRFPLIVVLYYAMKPYSTYFANWLRKGMRRFRRSKPKVEEKK